MPKLFLKDDGSLLGELTEAQLKFLEDQLEEEAMDDQDYAITPLLLAFFEGQDADPALLALLRKALGNAEEVTVSWEK